MRAPLLPAGPVPALRCPLASPASPLPFGCFMSSNESADYRAFRGIWIPAEVWLSQEMTLQEKVMLVEINSLQHPDRGCFKSNRALSEFFSLSISRVSEIIASLDRKGLVRVDLIRDGRQVVERRIFMTHPFDVPENLKSYGVVAP